MAQLDDAEDGWNGVFPQDVSVRMTAMNFAVELAKAGQSEGTGMSDVIREAQMIADFILGN